uniref:FBA_2 domain-containing protein n=1 Tax=Steinernema glaseri TaxID=37863 RepID=A0A1I8AJZ1_9BILA
MDSVPLCFIQSVLRSFKIRTGTEARNLPGLWGQLAEAYAENSGRLYIMYNVLAQRDGCMLYKLFGWKHLKKRTICPEVVREISKSLIKINFSFIRSHTYDDERDDEKNWYVIDPEDDDVRRLIMCLDAPEHSLNLYMPQGFYKKLESTYVHMVSKYSEIFRTFTHVRLHFFGEPASTLLFQSILSSRRLQSIVSNEPVPANIPTSLWVDYFFSERCSSIYAHFEDFNVVLEIIDRWKKTDLRRTRSSKRLSGLEASPDDFANVHMEPMTEDLPGARWTLEGIARKWEAWTVASVHWIGHPVQPTARIFVVFLEDDGKLGSNCSILFD